MRITRNHQEHLEGITQKKEIDIEENPILEENMMITHIEGDFKIDMIGLIQEKDLIDIKQNIDLTLETDTVEMT